MINPWRKIVAVFRLIDDVKFLYRRITVMSRNLSDLNLIYRTEAEIKNAIRNYEALRAKTDGRYNWDREILALEAELKRREIMRQEGTKITNKQVALDETDKKPWYEWEWSEIIEESNFITFPYEDYWVCRHKHAHDALAVGETRQGALDNCILVLRLSRDVERADNQEGAE